MSSDLTFMKHFLIAALILAVPFAAHAQDVPLQFTIPALVKEMAPGVVHITIVDSTGKPSGYGSGFVINENGTIVTAYHVLRGAPGAMVKTFDGEIYDKIDVVQYDLRRDIVILRIQPFRPLKSLKLTDADELVVGENAAAIGNPQGLEATVSAGIISGFRQTEGYRLIQTTVPVSPGSSGGPLFNMKGAVVGMITSALAGDRSQNLNFAVPATYISTLLQGDLSRVALLDFTKRIALSPLAALAALDTSAPGEVSFAVLHAHGNFNNVCNGRISVDSKNVTFDSDFPDHRWIVPVSSISETGSGVRNNYVITTGRLRQSTSSLPVAARPLQLRISGEAKRRVAGDSDQMFILIDVNRMPHDPSPIIDAINEARHK